MTVEGLRKLGENAEQDVKNFIWQFWREKGLTWKQQGRVEKLILKEGDRQRQQLASDFPAEPGIQADCEANGESTEAGIAANFIEMTKGLVVAATSKIHAMGMFSPEFEIGRGVRQGCPLAPMLFAATTKPLMLILQERAREGRINDFQIKGEKQMLYQFFADDSGVMIQANLQSFEELNNAIRLYEKISGAKLNVGKSTIIPMGMERVPEWLRNTGCKIAMKGEIIRYLGFPIGWGVSKEEQRDYIIAKIQKRMNNWKFRLLSFAGRTVALKHILRAMPIHLFACSDFTTRPWIK
ncbi:hypothetical protein R1sor_012439 [Riccia sorocarpa]|uniref:Reverse transcriptase domain-containing protein n=1 Tax=Riccia sorocarpa TaxID=122646 RepID=A0ABD3I450_9MARC